ncbi:hypothetical protein TWF481_006134 [Arthrobotrys musiformis]|uniref:F-box domain-containing protein n=1 Tax=Arthrobotrys musiformis TaxID=47236 RepID=A0AAV9WHG1_9PEZI
MSTADSNSLAGPSHSSRSRPAETEDSSPVGLTDDAWYAVLAFMDVGSLRSISACSRRFRELAAPTLFSSVCIGDEGSREAFEGGSLAGMRVVVRHITVLVQDLNFTRSPSTEAPKPTRTALELSEYSLEIAKNTADIILLFGNLKSITLVFQAYYLPPFASVVVLSEVFQRLSECPSHENIQDIGISHYGRYARYASAWDDLETCSIHDDRPEGTYTSFRMPHLQQLEIKSYGAINFSNGVEDTFAQPQWALLHSSAPTMKKLSISAESFYSGSAPGYVSNLTWRFPAMESLQIILHKCLSDGVMDVIVKLFPNLCYLTLDAAGYDTTHGGAEQPLYPQLKHLNKLKRIRILWYPTTREEVWKRPPLKQKHQMAETIKYWVEGGLNDLTYVQFIRRKPRDSPLENFQKNPRDDEDRLAFSVKHVVGGGVELECRMQFPDWYRAGHHDTFYLELEDVMFYDKGICQYLEEFELGPEAEPVD